MTEARRELKVSPRELEEVLRLDAPARYRYFVKRVADWQAAWGLDSDGWATMEDDAGTLVVPLWPARAYAQAARLGVWEEYEPKEISLRQLLEHFLPMMAANGYLPGVFPAPSEKCVIPPVQQLEQSLRLEMEQYGDDD